MANFDRVPASSRVQDRRGQSRITDWQQRTLERLADQYRAGEIDEKGYADIAGPIMRGVRNQESTPLGQMADAAGTAFTKGYNVLFAGDDAGSQLSKDAGFDDIEPTYKSQQGFDEAAFAPEQVESEGYDRAAYEDREIGNTYYPETIYKDDIDPVESEQGYDEGGFEGEEVMAYAEGGPVEDEEYVDYGSSGAFDGGGDWESEGVIEEAPVEEAPVESEPEPAQEEPAAAMPQQEEYAPTGGVGGGLSDGPETGGIPPDIKQLFDYGRQSITGGDQGVAQVEGPAVPSQSGIAAYLSGAGAMQPQQGEALERRVDPRNEMSDSERKLAAARLAISEGGPQMAWGYAQLLRQKVDAFVAQGNEALRQGDIDQAVVAANKATDAVPDGQNVTFERVGNAIRAYFGTGPDAVATGNEYAPEQSWNQRRDQIAKGIKDFSVTDALRFEGPPDEGVIPTQGGAPASRDNATRQGMRSVAPPSASPADSITFPAMGLGKLFKIFNTDAVVEDPKGTKGVVTKAVGGDYTPTNRPAAPDGGQVPYSYGSTDSRGRAPGRTLPMSDYGNPGMGPQGSPVRMGAPGGGPPQDNSDLTPGTHRGTYVDPQTGRIVFPSDGPGGKISAETAVRARMAAPDRRATREEAARAPRSQTHNGFLPVQNEGVINLHPSGFDPTGAPSYSSRRIGGGPFSEQLGILGDMSRNADGSRITGQHPYWEDKRNTGIPDHIQAQADEMFPSTSDANEKRKYITEAMKEEGKTKSAQEVARITAAGKTDVAGINREGKVTSAQIKADTDKFKAEYLEQSRTERQRQKYEAIQEIAAQKNKSAETMALQRAVQRTMGEYIRLNQPKITKDPTYLRELVSQVAKEFEMTPKEVAQLDDGVNELTGPQQTQPAQQATSGRGEPPGPAPKGYKYLLGRNPETKKVEAWRLVPNSR